MKLTEKTTFNIFKYPCSVHLFDSIIREWLSSYHDLGVGSVRSFYREILAQMPRKLSYYPEINYGITSLEPTDFDLATAEDVVTVVESSSEPTFQLSVIQQK